MSSELAERIRNNPKYKELTHQRNSFGWTMTILMLLVYYGFILVIAFHKQLGDLFSQPLGEGWTTTIGIPVGFGVILFTIIITAIYVRRANTTYDALTEEIMKEIKQ